MVENLTATLRRKREGANPKDPARSTPRIPRRTGVSVGNTPRRQQSDPAPVLHETASAAEEAVQAAKELENRRIRSRSAGPGNNTASGMDTSEQHQRVSGRRGARQRSNLQAQQSLRHALNEEIKSKEEAAGNPLLASSKEGEKEATWISRRKNRLALSQQAQDRAQLSET